MTCCIQQERERERERESVVLFVCRRSLHENMVEVVNDRMQVQNH